MVTNSAPMPMPTSALTTNCTDERCTRRTTSSTTAAEIDTAKAVRSSLVVSQRTVKRIVGTAASIIPRRPPSAVESCCRTTASTDSTVGLAAAAVSEPASEPVSGPVTGAARSAG